MHEYAIWYVPRFNEFSRLFAKVEADDIQEAQKVFWTDFELDAIEVVLIEEIKDVN